MADFTAGQQNIAGHRRAIKEGKLMVVPARYDIVSGKVSLLV
jgi:hypothetical protein